ncbi:hypothetical protein GCM10017620_20370 [Brevundimonas intermedia]|uniref:Uncharacterized protein n=1 Tax=Brevundimonas intermedia TaxID=74315 RepID=A0ABQ5TAH6_9CAUL|nr:hypothetical protein GCM10017620_20370 [Brevundimonas intermedia]
MGVEEQRVILAVEEDSVSPRRFHQTRRALDMHSKPVDLAQIIEGPDPGAVSQDGGAPHGRASSSQEAQTGGGLTSRDHSVAPRQRKEGAA